MGTVLGVEKEVDIGREDMEEGGMREESMQVSWVNLIL